MRTVFLVPRRSDADTGGHRDKLWAWCRKRWERYFPDIPIYEGHHDDGPFNRSAAVNRAAALASDWDLAIVIDSDVFLRVSSVRAAIDRAAQTGKVTWAHRRWRGLSEDWTRRTVADRRDFGAEVDATDMDVLIERTNPISWSCCIVIPRPVWNDLGGMDERFRGWGFEDLALQSVIVGLYGHERIEGDVYHLNHPRSEERITLGQPASTATSDYLANGRLGRRYMYALRRDHRMTDQDRTLGDDELKRDLSNLEKDDAKFALLQAPRERDYWERFGWPTLEELRDGAKLAGRTVTIVMHTGGEPAAWSERRAYLERSLASLGEMVSGPIVQRVLYADWGSEYLPELTAIANAHGFYVAGEGHHGYTLSMQRMWGYLGKRARGEYVFQVEDDFLYDRPVDLVPMIETLRDNPHLRQLALLRDAYYPRELEAGGVLPSLKTPTTLQNHRAYPFVEHRDHFTANPSLFHRSLTKVAWPQGESSERLFGDTVLRDPDARFAYWGSGEPWISHIGAVRAGASY